MKSSLFVCFRLGLVLSTLKLSISAWCPAISCVQRVATSQLASFRIRSKKRGRVIYDPKTGFYRPEHKDERDSNAQSSNFDEASAWDTFKTFIYNGIDGATSIPEKISKVTNAKPNDVGVSEGYRDVQNRLYQSGSKSVTPPLARLLEESQSRSAVASDEQPTQGFDVLKNAVYETVSVPLDSEPTNLSAKKAETFTPSVQSKFFVTQEFQEVLPDLQSENLIKKSIAQWKIEDWERQRRRRQKEIEREEIASRAKEIIYEAGDAALTTTESLFKLPGQLMSFVEKTARFLVSVPELIKKQIDAFLALPGLAQKSVSNAQSSFVSNVELAQDAVKATIESTQKTVREVQDIPNKIQNVVHVTHTKTTEVIEVIDGITTHGKVLLGIEKAKPRPPKIPPPQSPTSSGAALSIVKAVASEGGKFTWWVTKSTVSLAFGSIKLAAKNAAKFEEQNTTTIESSNLKTKPNATIHVRSPSLPMKSPTNSLPTIKSFLTKPPKSSYTSSRRQKELKGTKVVSKVENKLKEEEDLDKQVANALLLAEEALKLANSPYK